MAGGQQERIELAPGVSLGAFRLEEKLARGGMAEIWSATSSDDGHKVALKILLPQFCTDETFRGMFHDEVAIATRLHHPSIVRVLGAYDERGHLFLAMERLDGRDLRRLLSLVAQNEAVVDVQIAMAIARAMASGLHHAHTMTNEVGRPMEIVHRDVSPHNVMVTRAGHVKVLDFGIARAAERLTRTRTGVIKGKVAYMAPEQALAVGVTPQTDIFATGVVLWEMLAMRRLFRAPTEAESLERVVRAEVPAIRSLNRAVPEPLAELVHRMLALRAPDRPSSMADVVGRIDAIQSQCFDGNAVSAEELAAWAIDLIDVDHADTMMLPPETHDPTTPQGIRAADITEPTPAIERMDDTVEGPSPLVSVHDTAEDERIDVAQLPGAVDPSGPTGPNKVVDPSGPTGEHSAQSADTSAPTEAIRAVDIATMEIRVSEPSPPAVVTPSDQKLRLPTDTEIIRAVEAQATMPVRADPRFLANLPEIQVSVPKPGPSLSDPSDTQARPPSTAAAMLRTVERDDSSGAFEQIAPRLTPPVSQVSPPVPIPEHRRTGWWMPAVTVVLALVVVFLLFVLLTRG